MEGKSQRSVSSPAKRIVAKAMGIVSSAFRMENPATWTPAHHIIAQTIESHAFADKEVCGLSLPAMIVNALKEANLLVTAATDKHINPNGG
jgi:hypothetical protein